MEKELEKFLEDSEKGDLKLIVDFEAKEMKVETNPMEIEGIKYKSKPIKKGRVLDLKKRKIKEDNSLF
jgi:hypothetical protein